MELLNFISLCLIIVLLHSICLYIGWLIFDRIIDRPVYRVRSIDKTRRKHRVRFSKER